MKRMRRFCLCLGLIQALLTGSGEAAAPRPTTPDVRRDAAVEAVERVMPSVVNINTEEVVSMSDPMENLFRQFFDPYWRHNTQYSLGSGVIIDEEGYVLTNFHVVGRARRVWVKLSDGREFEADKVTGNSSTDVALVKIRARNTERFTPIRFAADDDLLLGETVLALGNPFGLGASVSKGILSSRSRRPPTDEPLDIRDWLQTDASINPGNSGGPLINLKGELIGINVAILDQAQGIGFAIPIKRVAERISEMFSPEWLDSIWFGARIRPGALPLVVTEVQPESPAELAGLQAQDVVLKVNDQEPRSFVNFVNLLRAAGQKKEITLVVQRAGKNKIITVRQIPERSFFNAELIRRKLAVSVTEVAGGGARRVGLSQGQGLLIESVERGSAAEQAKVQRGMIVTGIDGQTAEEIVKAAKRLYAKRKGEKVRLDLLVPMQRGAFYGYSQGAVELVVR
jgi:S1-C subfamily serine protease